MNETDLNNQNQKEQSQKEQSQKEQRQQKLEKLKNASGINVYPYSYKPDYRIQEVLEKGRKINTNRTARIGDKK